MLSEMLESDVIEDKEQKEQALSTLCSNTGKNKLHGWQNITNSFLPQFLIILNIQSTATVVPYVGWTLFLSKIHRQLVTFMLILSERFYIHFEALKSPEKRLPYRFTSHIFQMEQGCIEPCVTDKQHFVTWLNLEVPPNSQCQLTAL